MITTDQDLPEPYLWKLAACTKLWEWFMIKPGNILTRKTRTFGRIRLTWYPNQKREQLLTITAHVDVEYGYRQEENWLTLLHGLTGMGYCRVTGIFSSQRTLNITATKSLSMVQYSLPNFLEYSR